MSKENEVLDLTQAIAIKNGNNELVAFKTQAGLRVANGTLVNIPGGVGTIISAKGFQELAGKAGLVTLCAPTVTVDGVEQSNPRLEKDAEGNVKRVYARAYCFGYSLTGVPTVTDRTVIFDLSIYRALDLVGKCRKFPNDFKLAAVGAPVPDGWGSYPSDEVTCIHVNLQSSEFQTFLRNALNRQKKSVEIAQTFATRNAIKAHPMVPEIDKIQGGSVIVPVLAYRAKKGEMSFDLVEYKGQLARVHGIAGGGNSPNVDSQTEHMHEADPNLVEAIEGELVDETDRPGEAEAEPSGIDRERLIKEISAAGNDDFDLYKTAFEAAFPTGDAEQAEIEELSDPELVKLHEAIAAELGEG